MSFLHTKHNASLSANVDAGVQDFIESLHSLRLVAVFGWQDIRQRYRRSVLGPFWITITMAVMIGALGLVFGKVLNTPMKDYLPFLSMGLITWGFISSAIHEGCTAFINVEGMIRQMRIPFTVYILRMMWRNIIIFVHNIVIFPFVCIILGHKLSIVALLSIPGYVLVCVNLMWVAVVSAIICTRFRDVTQIISSILQVVFYISPIIWMPNSLSGRAAAMIIKPNPVYHMLSVVRDPMLGITPSMLSWLICVGLAVCGWAFAFWLLGRERSRVAYWL